MVNIKIGRDEKESFVELKGSKADVCAELMMIAEQVAKDGKDLGEMLILGLISGGLYTKEEIENTVNAAFQANELKKLLKKCENIDKNLDKKEKKCENSKKAASKTDEKDDDISKLFEVASALEGIINLLGDKKDE